MRPNKLRELLLLYCAQRGHSVSEQSWTMAFERRLQSLDLLGDSRSSSPEFAIPTRAQGARASFTVGLIVALIVGLAAAAPSEGKDCQSDTMLPSDVRVTIPGADV